MRTGAFIKLLTVRMMNLLSSIKMLLCLEFDVILCCLSYHSAVKVAIFFLLYRSTLPVAIHFRFLQTSHNFFKGFCLHEFKGL